jgi:energy-coupling factor transport system ATP-binding protein
MIELSHVSYSYPGAAAPALRDLSLRIDEGEFLLVCGPSGAGKSTFLRLLNGLVPHFYGGRFAGSVRLWGRDTLAHQPRDLADLVGFVFQDPEGQFVVDIVEDEIVFGMENLGLAQPIMRRRVEEVLDQLGIAHLRRQRISTLSGGEKQRVAIAAALAAQPRALVLDEPTSQLDPHGAEDVLTALQKLNADLGLTIVLCEHRLERVVQYADRILSFPGGGGQPAIGPARAMLAQLDLVPPLQALGRAIGWAPLPLTIKEGRAFVARSEQVPGARQRSTRATHHPTLSPTVRVERLTLRYGDHEALYRLSLEARPGELLALMGRNGSGKSSLLRALIGLVRPQEGRIELAGQDIARRPTEELARTAGYVPQNPQSILFHDTLREELAFTLRGRQPAAQDSIMRTLELLGIAHLADTYPRALSGGEAQRAALAAVLVGNPAILLLDEPTRGLDYQAKTALAELLRGLCAAGRTVIMATHDVELAAACADRVALLGDGELVVEGPAAEVLGDSLFFSSQIAKLFPGTGWLTLADALRGMGAAPVDPHTSGRREHARRPSGPLPGPCYLPSISTCPSDRGCDAGAPGCCA